MEQTRLERYAQRTERPLAAVAVTYALYALYVVFIVDYVARLYLADSRGALPWHS